VFPHDVQAGVIATMANGVVIERPDYADGVEILTLALAGVLLIFLTRYVYAGLATTVILIAAVLLAVGICLVIFYGYLTLLPLELALSWSLCMPTVSSL
jgi:adenylate cyclase